MISTVNGIDLEPFLDQVEGLLRRQVASSSAFVDEAARHLIESGGKRFRPMLVGLIAHLGDPTDPRLLDAAAIVELVHLATLYHDDVIDEATARRGAPSANLRWDNTVAILTGDYLFARASELSAGLGVEVTRMMARTIATLCEGQIRDVQGSRVALPPDVPPLAPDVDHYLGVVADKTASLIATSCRLGALLSGCAPATVETVGRYGWSLGMAFQLADDILDVVSDAEQSGKTPGADLREGVPTLPTIYALEDEPPEGELARLLVGGPLDDRGIRRALELLRSHDAIRRSREMAARYAAEATATLAPLGDPAAVTAMRLLADHTVIRRT